MKSPTLKCFFVLSCLPWIACSPLAARNDASAQKKSKDAPTQSFLKTSKLPHNIIEIESGFTKEKTSTWSVGVTRMSGGENLESIYFLDKMHGWIVGDRALYKTTNGGQTWEPIKIDVPQDAKLVNLFFVTPSTGWVVLQKQATDALHYQEYQFWLARTTDGGQTWQLQHEDKDSGVTRIFFVNEQEGWLTGVRYIGLSPLRFVHLILHTVDQGQHWTDVSGDLNRLASNERGMVNDFIADIKSEGPLNATVLTSEGKIFKADDGGQHWQILGSVHDDWGWPGYNRLGIKEDRHFWVAGGADSSRGMWGMLLVDQDKSWRKYKLRNVYFRDALFLSENQVLACGYIPSDENRATPNELTHGVILSSSDGGRNWSIIYRNAQIKSVKAFAAVDSNHIWAVGEGGLLLRLQP
jgi:photosystem II stability/assembly factor-like uncharacterized protein